MIAPMKEVKGRTAFVTGAASGIGLGIARALANAGANVMLADLNQERLEEAKKSIGHAGHVDTVILDVTDREGFKRAADATEKRFGKVHILVNNAGVGILGPVALATYDDWDWGLGVNLGGVINGLVTFMPRIKAHGEGGQIVSTASKAAIVPIPNSAIYTTAKCAIMGLTESIRSELEADNIGISAFCPGPVQTNIRESAKLRPEKYRAGSGYKEFEAQMATRPNAGVWMSPEEVGERVLLGIRRNDLYILTHPEFRDGFKSRAEAILASFPEEPIDEARKAAIPFLIRNRVFEETATIDPPRFKKR